MQPAAWMRITSRTHASRILIACFALALVLLTEFLHPSLDRRLDEGFRDVFLRLNASPVAEDRLAIIDINEDSIQRLGPWPWPRGRIADILEILISDYEAKAVALDMIFPEPSQDDPLGEARLASLLQYGPVAIAQVLDYAQREEPHAQGTLIPPPAPMTARSAHARPAYGYIANHAGLAHSRCAGNIGFKPDPDGVLRRIPLFSEFGQSSYPHLALSLLTCTSSYALEQFLSLPNSGWRLPFRHAPDAFTVIPAADLLQGPLDQSLIRDRYVLVGSSSLSLGDRVSTPLSPIVPGVLLHAEAASALLDMAEGLLAPPRNGRVLLLVWSVLSLPLAMFLVARWPAWRSVVLLISLAGIWLLVSFLLLRQQIHLSITPPLWGYFCLLLLAVPHEWHQSQRQFQKVTETLSHYVARPVLDELLRRGITHSLEPSLREITVLIADMASYTQTTTALPLAGAANLTKAVLDCLTGPVLSQGGTLDRYSGDGLIAFWGAPLDCPQQADRAVQAALEMFRAIDRFNLAWTAEGHTPVRIRIGIESGQALVGDLGTPFRSTYTAVGDCINFASRLEAAARDLPSPLIIGPVANSKLTQFQTYAVTSLRVRGTERVLEVFSIQAERGSERA